MATVSWNTITDALLSPVAGTTVNTNVGTKQTLYTVPTGKKMIPTRVIVGQASATLAAMADSLTFGFNGTNFGGVIDADMLALMTGATVLTGAGPGSTWVIGSASDVFGCVFNDTAITATVKVWVFGFVIPA